MPIPSLKSVKLSVPVLERFTADTLQAVTLTYDSLTLNICSVSNSVTLYQILAKSINQLLSYSDLNILPNDFEHVSHVMLRCGIIVASLNSVNLSVPGPRCS